MMLRLYLAVEEAVSDSQCGFRAGRGCVNMIFYVRQLEEQAMNIILSCYYFLLTYTRPMILYPVQ